MRATELAKYFASLGHEVILYGTLGNYNYNDFCKQTGVVVKDQKRHLAEENSDGNITLNIIDRIMIKLFHKILEYPNIEYLWKIPQILKKENNIDLLITVAHPFPIHWGAAIAKSRLKAQFPKVWISDCGDPYMGNTVIKYPFYFKYIEKYWARKTDYITIPIEESRKGYYPEFQSKIKIIPQGFDFTSSKIVKEFQHNSIPTFAYAGAVYPGYRDPSRFLDYLCTLSIDFKFIVYTRDFNFYKKYKEILKEKLELRNYIPREELLYELSKMDFLINLLNSESIQSPSKLIDYFLTKRPILDISSAFKELDNFQCFLNRDYQNQHNCQNVEQYNIINVGNKFLK